MCSECDHISCSTVLLHFLHCVQSGKIVISFVYTYAPMLFDKCTNYKWTLFMPWRRTKMNLQKKCYKFYFTKHTFFTNTKIHTYGINLLWRKTLLKLLLFFSSFINSMVRHSSLLSSYIKVGAARLFTCVW